MFASSLWMTLALALAADTPPPRAPSVPVARVEYCTVVAIDKQEVPGADAGLLVEMIAREGMKVTKDMELARIDDRQEKAQLVVKELEFQAAEQEAKSDIGVRYQQATADVAKTAWRKLLDANKGTDRAVAEIDVLRMELEYRKANLGILKEQEANATNILTARAKKAEVDAAKISVARRVLRAPFDGVVVKVSKHVGEWVAAGEPVVEVVGIDRLSIRGNLLANEWEPADIEGRNVTVEFMLARGRVEKVPGKVVYVSPLVDGGKLEVWAEVDSPKDKDGRYIVPAGVNANMTVHVSQPPKAEPRPTAATRVRPADKATTKN